MTTVLSEIDAILKDRYEDEVPIIGHQDPVAWATTKKTIDSIKQRTHWNINNIKPKDPVLLGLCHRWRPDRPQETDVD